MPYSIGQVEEELEKAFRATWPVEFRREKLTAEESNRAMVLAREKYCQVDWPQRERHND